MIIITSISSQNNEKKVTDTSLERNLYVHATVKITGNPLVFRKQGTLQLKYCNDFVSFHSYFPQTILLFERW